MPLADVATLAPPTHAVVVLAQVQTWTTVVVRPGDTLWDLAIAHHTTVTAIVEKNRLAGGGAMIHVGQRLLVPGAPPRAAAASKPSASTPVGPKAGSPKPTVAGRVYVVRAGDTMFDIAMRYHVSLTKLLAANRLKNAHLIFVGQHITVPVRISAPAPGTPSPDAKPPSGYKPSSKTEKAVAASKAKLAGLKVPTRAQTAELIKAAAARHGVDPKLALAVGWLESGWFQRAVSYTDAVGVMQIMPLSATWASQLAGRTLDRYDTRDNITAGVLILRALQATADDREQAIAGYYQGLRSVRTKGMYEDTKKYVASVLAIYRRL
jgi:LysM repeat protein